MLRWGQNERNNVKWDLTRSPNLLITIALFLTWKTLKENLL